MNHSRRPPARVRSGLKIQKRQISKEAQGEENGVLANFFTHFHPHQSVLIQTNLYLQQSENLLPFSLVTANQNPGFLLIHRDRFGIHCLPKLLTDAAIPDRVTVAERKVLFIYACPRFGKRKEKLMTAQVIFG